MVLNQGLNSNLSTFLYLLLCVIKQTCHVCNANIRKTLFYLPLNLKKHLCQILSFSMFLLLLQSEPPLPFYICDSISERAALSYFYLLPVRECCCAIKLERESASYLLLESTFTASVALSFNNRCYMLYQLPLHVCCLLSCICLLS